MTHNVTLYRDGKAIAKYSTDELRPAGENALTMIHTDGGQAVERTVCGTISTESAEPWDPVDGYPQGAPRPPRQEYKVTFLGGEEPREFRTNYLIHLYVNRLIVLQCSETKKQIRMTSPFIIEQVGNCNSWYL